MVRAFAWAALLALCWGVYSSGALRNPLRALPAVSPVANALPPLPPGCKEKGCGP
jgi:hypothetical protein